MTRLLTGALLYCLWGIACLLVADFFSGLGHWLEDTYGGNDNSNWLKSWIVDDNITHHRKPNTILNGGWWECNRVLMSAAAAVAVVCICLRLWHWQVYLTLLIGSHSNHIHRWAHTAKVPRVVALLQKAGIFQSRQHHARHHFSPYSIRFCTTTNWLNPVLDAARFWRGLEWAVGAPIKRAGPLREGF